MVQIHCHYLLIHHMLNKHYLCTRLLRTRVTKNEIMGISVVREFIYLLMNPDSIFIENLSSVFLIIGPDTLPIIFTKASLNRNNPVKCMKLPPSHR